MKLTYYIRSLLLMLFALLQCVAPLAHAHVNGDNADQSIHLDISSLSRFGDYHHHNDADVAQFSAIEYHSATVCMPPECRSSKLVIDHPVAVSQDGKVVFREHSAVVFDDCYEKTLFLTPYQHPFSQAPPV